MYQYVEQMVGFSRAAFEQAYSQCLGAGDTSPEGELTLQAYDRMKKLESGGEKIDFIIVSGGKIILLYGNCRYEVISGKP